MSRKRIAIVGGGAAGVALAWCLTSLPQLRRDWAVTLLHDEADLGGHARTVTVWFDDAGVARPGPTPAGRRPYPVDLGVQFICRSLNPNLYRHLELPQFRDRVRLHAHPNLRIAGAFGGDMIWGNFPDYQGQPRFGACLDRAARQHARWFERDLHGAWWRRVRGRRVWTLTVDGYLALTGIPRHSHFVRYQLMPYLCLLNGYRVEDLLATAMCDLFPLFTRLPFVRPPGPGASFLRPGYGWDRYADGAVSWIDAMAGSAEAHGARLRTGCTVKRVTPTRHGVMLEWDAPAFSDSGWAHFDTVVLTTDMTTNRELLSHPDNPHWTHQAPYLHADRFPLTRGRCYLHQDESLLAPELRDGKEDGQFTGGRPVVAGGADPRNHLLPYDLRSSRYTYLMSNIAGTPYPCYVTMCADRDDTRRPDPARVIAQRGWQLSGYLPTRLRTGVRDLHHAQGLGNVYFAGNNTTVDSQEGALLSAMIIAHRVTGYPYPFPRGSHAHVVYRRYASTMFPS